MNDRITIEGRDGSFGVYIARPEVFPAPAVLVLQEVFGVNGDIREHCGELAQQGFVAVAPDLYWRQEPAPTSASTLTQIGSMPFGCIRRMTGTPVRGT
jgi:dienelactone hydrolase